MKSCPSLGEQKGIFPGGLVRNSRLCVLGKQGMVLLGCVCTDGRTGGGKGIVSLQEHPYMLQLGFGFSYRIPTARGVW